MTTQPGPTITSVSARVTELRAELRQLERQLDAYDQPSPRLRPRRRIAAIAALAIALILPAGVLANHVFGDVPTSSTFHNNVANIYRAGITTGCGVGLYCPSESVRRDQMAAFLNRGLGRGGNAEGQVAELDNDGSVVTYVEITVPGAGWIHVTADGMGSTTETTGCPCEVSLEVYSPELLENSKTISDLLDNAPGGGGAYAHVGVNDAFSIPEAGTYTFEVWMYRNSGSTPVDATATVLALWVPFGNEGNANYGLAPNAAREPGDH